MTRLILASASPRRKELLNRIAPSFQCIPADVDEQLEDNLLPKQAVMELALRKAKAVAEKEKDAFVIGADTVVVYQNEIFGKPGSHEEAFQMLRTLSGRTHSVFTGTAIVFGDKQECFYEETKVTFWELSDEEIIHYIDTGEPFDKAGSYGIQGFGATLVEKIEGDYFNVVGLPIAKLYRVLKRMGYPF